MGDRGRPRDSLRVLVVDDDQAQARMLERLLSCGGHVVTSVASAEAALDLLETADVDVVVSDVWLGGGLNGWHLAEHLQQRRPHVRVCLVTGWGAPADPSEAAERGVAAVLGKPYRLRDLLAAVAPS